MWLALKENLSDWWACYAEKLEGLDMQTLVQNQSCAGLVWTFRTRLLGLTLTNLRHNLFVRPDLTMIVFPGPMGRFCKVPTRALKRLKEPFMLASISDRDGERLGPAGVVWRSFFGCNALRL